MGMGLQELDLTISQIIGKYPETREVFIKNGFPIFSDDSVLKQLGSVLKLKTALKSKGMNAEVFIRLLQDKISEIGYYRGLKSTMFAHEGRLNMLTLLPCPLKVPLQSDLKLILEHMQREKGLSLNYSIDISANKHKNYGDYIQYFEDPDEVPDVMLTAGYDFFNKNFIDRFVKTGIFARLPSKQVNPKLVEAGIIDPDGHFTVIAVNILVMVVDKKRLGNLPMPDTWEDLMDPVYEKKVVIRGHGDIFCDIVQLNYYKDYGDQGIAQLARNVKQGLHPAQMVKNLASNRSDVPPIHIMPRFFAETIRNRKNIEIVWPKDGAMAYPVSMLIKADKLNEMQELVDYFLGPRVAQICDHAFFPAAYGSCEKLPATAKLKWTGWDYIKHCHIETLVDDLNRRFLKAYRAGGRL